MHPPAFSPDGSEIAFYALLGDSASILVLKADGSEARRLSHRFAQNYGPAWSPDRRSICYTVGVDGQWDIWRVDVATGAELPLVSDPAREESCAWRP